MFPVFVLFSQNLAIIKLFAPLFPIANELGEEARSSSMVFRADRNTSIARTVYPAEYSSSKIAQASSQRFLNVETLRCSGLTSSALATLSRISDLELRRQARKRDSQTPLREPYQLSFLNDMRLITNNLNKVLHKLMSLTPGHMGVFLEVSAGRNSAINESNKAVRAFLPEAGIEVIDHLISAGAEDKRANLANTLPGSSAQVLNSISNNQIGTLRHGLRIHSALPTMAASNR